MIVSIIFLASLALYCWRLPVSRQQDQGNLWQVLPSWPLSPYPKLKPKIGTILQLGTPSVLYPHLQMLPCKWQFTHKDLCMCTLMHFSMSRLQCHDWQGRIQNFQKGGLLHRGEGRGACTQGKKLREGGLVHRGRREGGTILAASSFSG